MIKAILTHRSLRKNGRLCGFFFETRRGLPLFRYGLHGVYGPSGKNSKLHPMIETNSVDVSLHSENGLIVSFKLKTGESELSMGKIFLHSDRKIESALVESRMNVETILFPKWYFNTLTLEQRKELSKRILPLLRRDQKFMLSKRRINTKADQPLYRKSDERSKKRGTIIFFTKYDS